MTMHDMKKPLGILFALFLVLFYASTVVITEGHDGLVLRFGKIESDGIKAPRIEHAGLHYQIPFLYQIREFDMRLRSWSVDGVRIMTSDKQEMTASYYVKWRISDLLRYFNASHGQERQMLSGLLESLQIDFQTQLGAYTFADLLTQNREKIMLNLRERLQKNADALGIAIIDIQLNRIQPSNIETRMQTALRQMAQQRRAEGKAMAASLRVIGETNAATAVAIAKEKAAEIRGEGDAEAAKRYADAFAKNPEFYSFLRSMEAYKKVFANDQSVLVIKPEGQFFKYFNYHQNQEKK